VVRIGIAKVHRNVAHVVMAIQYVSCVCSKCFICITRMLQVFSSGYCKSRFRCYLYIHVVRVFFKWFQVFFTSVASVSSRYCVCLQWFLSVFQVFFTSISDVCFKCFICLLYMLQLLHLDVLKVDPELHIGCVCEAADGLGEFRAAWATSGVTWAHC
jgi:hypothetical protein